MHNNEALQMMCCAGLVPYVTLYHWDLPQALEDSYGGWLSPRVMYDIYEFMLIQTMPIIFEKFFTVLPSLEFTHVG